MKHTNAVASGTIHYVVDEDDNIVGLAQMELIDVEYDPEFAGPAYNLTCKMIKWGALRAKAREKLEREKGHDLDGMGDSP